MRGVIVNFFRATWSLMLLWWAGLTSLAAQPADTTVLTASEFYGIIVNHHPLVRQAGLLSDEARSEVMQARGAFDPKLVSEYDRKEFGQNVYYDKWGAGLSIPILALGADLKVTYDRNNGDFINPEDRVPRSGLTGVGISIPVGQGLWADARRTALRQAQAAITLAEAERLKLINKTLFDAAKAYWEWYMTYQQLRLIDEGYRLADTRFVALRQRVLLGEAAAIDTTEALITVQDRAVQRQQVDVAYQNARLYLTTFLWRADGSTTQPVELPQRVIPQGVPPNRPSERLLQTLLLQAAEQHPDLTKLTAKAEQLRLEERFRRSLLQPQLSLNATLLSQTPVPNVGYDWSSYYAFRPDNHKIGASLVLPLFLRKERGKLRQIQLKAQQVGLDRQQTARTISNEVQTAWNELQGLDRQIQLQQQTVVNQRRLLQAEQQRFELGESSLFLVNAREAKRIDLSLKLEELRTKYQKALATLYYKAGTSGQE